MPNDNDFEWLILFPQFESHIPNDECKYTEKNSLKNHNNSVFSTITGLTTIIDVERIYFFVETFAEIQHQTSRCIVFASNFFTHIPMIDNSGE